MINPLSTLRRKLGILDVSGMGKPKEKPHYIYSNLAGHPVKKESARLYVKKRKGMCNLIGLIVDNKVKFELDYTGANESFLIKEAIKINGGDIWVR